MSKYQQIDLSKIKLISIKKRKSKVTQNDFAKVLDPAAATLADFFDSLPHILIGNDLRNLVEDILESRKKDKPVILMIGAHVIKVGLAPLVCDLVREGIVTHVAMNSAAAIHDVESAMWGHTSEDVAENILDGKFGMSKETGEFINKSLSSAHQNGNEGYGEVLGKKLIEAKAIHGKNSILLTCYEKGIPITVHAAIGTDIVHQQPTMDGAAVGETSFRDFKILANSVKNLKNGGVVLNIGSAVILPEVFLKALTVARNLGFRAEGFSTANFDMIRHYRPTVNVVERPTQEKGRGYNFIGHHEIMIPLLTTMIKHQMKRKTH